MTDTNSTERRIYSVGGKRFDSYSEAVRAADGASILEMTDFGPGDTWPTRRFTRGADGCYRGVRCDD
jgi:hypothetical protein